MSYPQNTDAEGGYYVVMASAGPWPVDREEYLVAVCTSLGDAVEIARPMKSFECDVSIYHTKEFNLAGYNEALGDADGEMP